MRVNPQKDAASRRIKKDAMRGFEDRHSRLDARNMGVANRLTMPEVPQKSSTAIQESDGTMKFIVGYSRVGGTDVVS